MDINPEFMTARDGTTIATYEAGVPDGPVIILCHGLGGSLDAWRHQIKHFGDRFRIVTWDYRGLYRSGRPLDGGTDASYSMERHCDDLEDLVKAKHVDRAVFMGWSMGVQVSIEYWRRRPEQFLGLVSINGTSGHVFETAFRSEWLKAIAPVALDAVQTVAPVLAHIGPVLAPYASRTRAVVALAKASGLCSPTLDESIFLDIAAEYLRLDFSAYAMIFRALGKHNAEAILADMRVPALVIAGEKDLFTPCETAKNIAQSIQGAEFTVVQGGTHYTPIEYPAVVNARIEKFLRERLHLI